MQLESFFRHAEDVAKINLQTNDLRNKPVTAIVQGFGNVGYHASKFLSEDDGCKIIGLIEYNGALYNPDGINIEDAKRFFIQHGSFENYSNGQFLPEANKLLEEECDILIPAALESTIHSDNAESIKAKLIVEAANGPVTAEADKILRDRGVIILPDLFVNAGGVIVSYFEWVKNITHIPFGLMEKRHHETQQRLIAESLEHMTGKKLPSHLEKSYINGGSEIDLVRSGLDEVMRATYTEMSELWNNNQNIPDLRTAGYTLSIQKIADAYHAIGI